MFFFFSPFSRATGEEKSEGRLPTIYTQDLPAQNVPSDLRYIPSVCLTLSQPSPISQSVAFLTSEQEVAGFITGSANILSED